MVKYSPEAAQKIPLSKRVQEGIFPGRKTSKFAAELKQCENLIQALIADPDNAPVFPLLSAESVFTYLSNRPIIFHAGLFS